VAGGTRAGESSGQTRRAAAQWLVWNQVPQPVRVPARSLIALSRRLRAHSTAIPVGPAPPLPPSAVELRTLHGSFWFDGVDEKVTPWIRRHATWEADVVRFLGSVVRPGMVAVDVGANIGFLTVLMAKLVGPAGRVHAYEPWPGNLELLHANLWRHTCGNVTVHAAAALHRAGTVSFERDAAGDSGARVELDGAGAFEVDAVTLADTVPEPQINVLKIDVEGAEPLVLEGAAPLLARSRSVVAVVEFRGTTHLDGRSPEAVLDFYGTLGLETYRLLSSGQAVAATHGQLIAAAAADETINIVLRG
jgi:FkbM family methyltransferase